MPFNGLIEQDRGRIRRHRLRIEGRPDRGSRRKRRIGLEEEMIVLEGISTAGDAAWRAIQETMARRTGRKYN